MNKALALILTLATTISAVSCSIIQTSIPQQVEGERRPDGTWYLYDTPSHRAEFQRMMDMHIEDEKAGLKPSGGHKQWNEFWLSIIRVLTPDRQQNPAKYIDCIIESRRRAGLPELEGYPQTNGVD